MWPRPWCSPSREEAKYQYSHWFNSRGKNPQSLTLKASTLTIIPGNHSILTIWVCSDLFICSKPTGGTHQMYIIHYNIVFLLKVLWPQFFSIFWEEQKRGVLYTRVLCYTPVWYICYLQPAPANITSSTG
jgi:hypothetical protein